jgi:hypothetical protein
MNIDDFKILAKPSFWAFPLLIGIFSVWFTYEPSHYCPKQSIFMKKSDKMV